MKRFWQVPLKEKPKEISAFTTLKDLYQYEVMPFGEKNSLAIFQRFIETMTFGLDSREAHFDDVLLYKDTWYEYFLEVLWLPKWFRINHWPHEEWILSWLCDILRSCCIGLSQGQVMSIDDEGGYCYCRLFISHLNFFYDCIKYWEFAFPFFLEVGECYV